MCITSKIPQFWCDENHYNKNINYGTVIMRIMLTTDQIQVICEEIKQDKRVCGILLTGSYVYGYPN